mmetsp:Transcript_59114/g.139316  ORF Transcript_59114/g.139316 Transcript_59114/m.139316 type:complete len:302 (+) Transcript_59114:1644-2549(+)
MNEDDVAVFVRRLEERMLDVAVKHIDVLQVLGRGLLDSEPEAVHVRLQVTVCPLASVQQVRVDPEVLQARPAVRVDRQRLLGHDLITRLLLSLCRRKRLLHVQNLLVDHHEILALLRAVRELAQVHELLVHARQRHPTAWGDEVETEDVAGGALLLHADVLDGRHVEGARDAVDGDQQDLCGVVDIQRRPRGLARKVLGALVPRDLRHQLVLRAPASAVLVDPATLLLDAVHGELLVALLELLALRLLLLLRHLPRLVLPELLLEPLLDLLLRRGLLALLLRRRLLRVVRHVPRQLAILLR